MFFQRSSTMQPRNLAHLASVVGGRKTDSTIKAKVCRFYGEFAYAMSSRRPRSDRLHDRLPVLLRRELVGARRLRANFLPLDRLDQRPSVCKCERARECRIWAPEFQHLRHATAASLRRLCRAPNHRSTSHKSARRRAAAFHVFRLYAARPSASQFVPIDRPESSLSISLVVGDRAMIVAVAC